MELAAANPDYRENDKNYNRRSHEQQHEKQGCSKVEIHRGLD